MVVKEENNSLLPHFLIPIDLNDSQVDMKVKKKKLTLV